MKAHQREVEAWLREIGASEVRVERTSRLGHPKLLFTFGGRAWSWPISSTPSDFNATRAMRSALRHALGLVDSERHVGDRRRKRKRRRPADAGNDRRASRFVPTHSLPPLNTPFSGLGDLLAGGAG